MNRNSVALIVAAVLAACSDPATGPDPGDMNAAHLPPPYVAAQNASTTDGPLLSVLPVEDALERILEVLPDSPREEEVRDALVSLRKAIEAGNDCAIRTTRTSAEEALRTLGKELPDEYEADLDVIGLALESVEQTGKGRC